MKLRRSKHHVLRVALLATILVFTGCSGRSHRAGAAEGRVVALGNGPVELLGDFADDYGGRHHITRDVWQHGRDARYLVVTWRPDSQYLIAQNAPDNPSEANRWTRIDWVMLPDTAPYTWAFCLTAYDAPTRAAAEATAAADRANPRMGCNGFPFSRMKRP